MKKCTKCELTFDESLFQKDKSKKDGLRSLCKKCTSIYKKIKYQENKDFIKIKRKEEYNKNKEKHLLSSKKYKELNKGKYFDYMEKWRTNNQEKIKEYNKKSYHKNKELSKNKVKVWREKNKVKVKEYSNYYVKKRLKEDSLFKFKHSTRTLIRNSFKRGCFNKFDKKSKAEEILGCSMSFFAEYISSKFLDGMSFYNHGLWHLDHIKPLFTAKTEEDVIILNHYTNFQPLWSFDNLSKGYKWEE